MDLLFQPGATCEVYKWLKHTDDFKNKVLLRMKTWYDRVSGPCSHSSSDKPDDHEGISPVDQLAVIGCTLSVKRLWASKELLDMTIFQRRKMSTSPLNF
jgi:hypothetical protein